MTNCGYPWKHHTHTHADMVFMGTGTGCRKKPGGHPCHTLFDLAQQLIPGSEFFTQFFLYVFLLSIEYLQKAERSVFSEGITARDFFACCRIWPMLKKISQSILKLSKIPQ